MDKDLEISRPTFPRTEIGTRRTFYYGIIPTRTHPSNGHTPQTVSFAGSSQNPSVLFRTPPYFSESWGIYQNNTQEEY